MSVTTLVKFVVGITHCFRLSATKHHLKIDRLKAVVMVAMNDASRAGNAFPWPETLFNFMAILILHEDVEMTLQNEEDLFHLMRMGCVPLSGRYEHDRERKISRRNRRIVSMLTGAASANKSMLSTLETLDLRILEGHPVRTPVGVTSDVAGP